LRGEFIRDFFVQTRSVVLLSRKKSYICIFFFFFFFFLSEFVLYLGPKHSKKPQIERAIPWSIGRMLSNFEANRSVSSCLKVGGSGGQGIGRSLKAKVKQTETTVS
jgi:hypothetical protein